MTTIYGEGYVADMMKPTPPPWLTDDEIVEATHRRQPIAQARALTLMGVPYRRRPDGTLLVGRAALELALSTATSKAPSNGLNWSRA